MKRFAALLVAFLCLLLGASPLASAEGWDVDRECRLTVHYAADGQNLSGLEVCLYRVAEALPDGTFQKIAPFADYPVSIDDVTTQTGWRQVAATLLGYVAADGIAPTATVPTDGGGDAVFSGLPTGLYLVGGVDTASWTFDGFLTYLPMQEEGVYTYAVTAKPKASRSVPAPAGTDYKLLKVWKDAGHTDARPASVTADILRDGALWSTVTLSAENNWSYSWTDPDSTAVWSVVERDMPEHYTVLVDKRATAFVLTNTWDEPDTPGTPDTPDAPGTPDTPDAPGTPDTPGTPDRPSPPQTGDTEPLWLYVLLMVFSGIGLMLVGAGGMRGKKYDQTK